MFETNIRTIPSIYNPLKILVVDDEPDVEGMLKLKYRREIRNGKYEFLFAENGREALEMLQEKPEIGIVISDINMPEMDGLTLLDRISELDRMLKAIIVSAYGDMDNIRTAMNRGAYDFVTKPIDFEDLTKTIEKTRSNLAEIIHSVDALNRAELSLKEVNARNQAIINTALDAIITIDSDGIIESANPAVIDVLGYNPVEMIGKDISMIIPEPDNEFHGNYIKQYLISNESNIIGKRRELEAIKKSGAKILIELAVSEINLGDRKLFTGTITDITIRKRAEYLLKEFNTALEKEANERNKELIKLNNEKNEILGIAAHDLKNPLSNIKMIAKLIKEDTSLTHDDILEFSDDILTTSERMFEMIKNLLDINRIEQGKIDLEPEYFSLKYILNIVVGYFKDQAESKGISIILENDEEDDYICYADRNAASQVLENLISNAVKYSPYNKKVYLKLYNNPNEVLFEVKDEGPGISHEDQNKLFGKFARLSAMPTGGENSTGLGLSIVKKLMELMNGKVWCESEIGYGASFFVSFPISQ
jgi:PAS domain S-box-containing protein